MTYVWIALGGAVGSVARFALSGLAARWLGQAFLGTMAINVTGSFLIGFTAAMGPTKTWEQVLIVGVLGGYTTFSSFSLQTLTLAQEGRWGAVGLNVSGSVILCLAGVWLGHTAGSWVIRR
jgi:CrcB protein